MGMAFLMKLAQTFTGGASEVSGSADASKNQLVAQGNPSYMETRRRGEGWTLFTSTAFAALVDTPTTVARLEVYNNGSRLAVVSDLHVLRVIGTAVALGEVIFAMISTAKAAPTLVAQTLYSMSGKAFIVPTATSEIVTGVGGSVIANGWAPYGAPSAYLGATPPGTGQSVPIDGKLIIPPGCSLCLQVVAAINTAAAFYVGATFDLVNATVEM